MSDKIKVKATKPGFYDNGYRKVGDVFEVDADLFSDFWMEKESVLPVHDQSQEAKVAELGNANAAIEDLGNILAGNPVAAGGNMADMSDDDLRAYFAEVMGEKAGNRKRETMIAEITEKLNAD